MLIINVDYAPRFPGAFLLDFKFKKLYTRINHYFELAIGLSTTSIQKQTKAKLLVNHLRKEESASN